MLCPRIGLNFRRLSIRCGTTGCPKKGVDKKLLVGAAHDFNSQFLNLSEFSISVSFVWCII